MVASAVDDSDKASSTESSTGSSDDNQRRLGVGLGERLSLSTEAAREISRSGLVLRLGSSSTMAEGGMVLAGSIA